MSASHSKQLSLQVRILIAFALVYLIWGSTYLAIRFAIQTIPPFLMTGARYLLAGSILFIWQRARGEPAPTLRQWKSAAIVGACLLFIGNGGLVWGEQQVPSGIAALLLATVPLWMALFEWLRRAVRPNAGVAVGLLVGFIGIVLLIGPRELSGDGMDLTATAAVLLAALFWAIGSLYSRTAELPRAPLLGTGMEMLAGGMMLIVTSLFAGEPARLRLDQISPLSIGAYFYLVTFGALVGFSAYTWLLQVTTTARASTYAYVNPVVAVFLGWALAGEPLTAQTLISAAIIIASVALITLYRDRSAPVPKPRPLSETTQATVEP